jgi:hypothetical protein
MTQTFRGLDGTVQNMGVDINKMSGPSIEYYITA